MNRTKFNRKILEDVDMITGRFRHNVEIYHFFEIMVGKQEK